MKGELLRLLHRAPQQGQDGIALEGVLDGLEVVLQARDHTTRVLSLRLEQSGEFMICRLWVLPRDLRKHRHPVHPLLDLDDHRVGLHGLEPDVAADVVLSVPSLQGEDVLCKDRLQPRLAIKGAHRDQL